MHTKLRNKLPEHVTELVTPDRVHSAIYTSPEIFELEIERIFHASWLYIGHDSEVPNRGDYKLRTMGRQPVILTRGSDGLVRVLMNRCRHRGALILEKETGCENHFRCPYHGWTYANTGDLIHVPEAGGYAPDFSLEHHGLTHAPLFDSYRGFVFASLSGAVKPLVQHLGIASKMIDLMVDASPVGAIALDMGLQRTYYNGNWKQVGMDGYHPNYLHVSTMSASSNSAQNGSGRHAGAEFFSNASWSDASDSVTRDLGNGHSMLDIMPQRMKKVDAYLDELRALDGGDKYIDAMLRLHGQSRAHELLVMAADPHLGLYPNAQLTANQVRIFNPLAVDRTEILMFPARIVGVSDAINANRLRNHEWFYGPAGSGSPDDAEIFERTQRGLMATVDPWIDVSRGRHREWVDTDGSIVGKITDEVPQRAQLKQWVGLMSAEAS